MKVALISLLLVSSVLAKDLIIANETGFTISEVYIARANTQDKWGTNRLSDKLPNHRQTALPIDLQKWKLWNLMIVLKPTARIIWQGKDAFDLTAINKITFQHAPNYRINANYE